MSFFRFNSGGFYTEDEVLFLTITVEVFPVAADEVPNTFPYFKGQIVIRWH